MLAPERPQQPQLIILQAVDVGVPFLARRMRR
jgi:hypothetical protein